MVSDLTKALLGANVVGSRTSIEKIFNEANSLPIPHCPFFGRKLSVPDVNYYAADLKVI